MEQQPKEEEVEPPREGAVEQQPREGAVEQHQPREVPSRSAPRGRSSWVQAVRPLGEAFERERSGHASRRPVRANGRARDGCGVRGGLKTLKDPGFAGRSIWKDGSMPERTLRRLKEERQTIKIPELCP